MDDKFLSQDEVDALLKGGGFDDDEEVVEKVDDDPNGPKTYNLATQERIVNARMPTLEAINQRFGRIVGDELFNFMRKPVEVTVKPLKISKYSDFIRNVIVPTNLNLVHAHPLRGSGLMIFDPQLVFLIIDTMFGGDGSFHTRVEGRDFTQTEQRIIDRILALVFKAYSEAWETIYPLNFEHVRSEMNMQFVNIATPNEVVVSAVFAIELSDHTAEMHFCFPYTMLEPLRDILGSVIQPETSEDNEQWTQLLGQQVRVAEVELVTELAKKNLPLGKVMNFKVGDVIPLNVSETVEATVDNVPVMECKYGVFNGQYALRVEQLLKLSTLDKGEPNGQ
jgi:flagellar motor switch protein FliM